MQAIETIDQYFKAFAPEQKQLLQQMRELITKAAPAATEIISYGMPTFQLHGNLVHFAMAKQHLGFYPSPSAIREFEKQLESYKTSKGAVQFPLDKSLPGKLITAMVRFRVQENEEKFRKKARRVCRNGHEYFKSSDCPVCPLCEKEKNAVAGFGAGLAAPARRALENEGITSAKKLEAFSEKQILALHGMGKASLPALRKILGDEGLKFLK